MRPHGLEVDRIPCQALCGADAVEEAGDEDDVNEFRLVSLGSGREEFVRGYNARLSGYTVPDQANLVAGVDLFSDGGDNGGEIVLDDRERVMPAARLELERDHAVAVLLEIGSDWLDVLRCVPAASDEDDAEVARHVEEKD